MKIRSDFVTNSSSSSFVAIKLNSNTLSTIVAEFYNELEKMCHTGELYGQINNYGDSVGLSMDEAYYDNDVDTMLDVLNAFISMFIPYGDKELKISSDDSANERVDLSEFENASTGKKLIAEIFKARKEILTDINFAELSLGYCGWGGDSESRYYEDSYSQDRLDEIYEEIAEENNCSVEEITEDDFSDYVNDKVSVEETVYTFVKKDGKVTKKVEKDFYLQ